MEFRILWRSCGVLFDIDIGHVHYVDLGQYWSYNIGQYCQSSILKKPILRLVFFKFNPDWSILVILKIFNLGLTG